MRVWEFDFFFSFSLFFFFLEWPSLPLMSLLIGEKKRQKKRITELPH